MERKRNFGTNKFDKKKKNPAQTQISKNSCIGEKEENIVKQCYIHFNFLNIFVNSV